MKMPVIWGVRLETWIVWSALAVAMAWHGSTQRAWGAVHPGRVVAAGALDDESCGEPLKAIESNALLDGSFRLDSSQGALRLLVGSKGYLVNERGRCQAQCQVVKLERYVRDMKPALLQLSCTATNLKFLRMPVFVVWEGEFPIIKLGSALIDEEEARFSVTLNRLNSVVVLPKTAGL